MYLVVVFPPLSSAPTERVSGADFRADSSSFLRPWAERLYRLGSALLGFKWLVRAILGNMLVLAPSLPWLSCRTYSQWQKHVQLFLIPRCLSFSTTCHYTLLKLPEAFTMDVELVGVIVPTCSTRRRENCMVWTRWPSRRDCIGRELGRSGSKWSIT